MSRTILEEVIERIVNVDHGLFIAIIFARRHHAELVVILKQRHRRNQHLGKIECVVLSKNEIVRHLLCFPFEREPSPALQAHQCAKTDRDHRQGVAGSGRIAKKADLSRVERIGRGNGTRGQADNAGMGSQTELDFVARSPLLSRFCNPRTIFCWFRGNMKR